MPALPLFPLGTVLFPGMPLSLHVFEQRYRALVQDLLAGPEPRCFGVVAIREGHEVGTGSVRSLYDVGCVAEIRQVQGFPDGRFALMGVGTRRFRFADLDRSRLYVQATVDLLDEPVGDTTALESAAGSTRAAYARYRELTGSGTPSAELPDDPTALSYEVAAAMVLPLPELQALLEAADTAQRLNTETDILARELGLIRGLRTVPLPKRPLPPGSQN